MYHNLTDLSPLSNYDSDWDLMPSPKESEELWEEHINEQSRLELED